MTALSSGQLYLADLHGSLGDPVLESMNFLNEVAGRFPAAVSFAAGRPFEGFFDTESVHGYLRTFYRYLVEDLGHDEASARRLMFQYGRTKGIIHELVAKNLAVDEGIHVDAESIVVTVGWQEAMFLTLRALRTDERDVLLAVFPTYVGATGAAQLVDMPVLPVHDGPSGVDLEHLAGVVRAAREAGQRPRALYVIPNFANPSAISMDLDTRKRLLAAAEEHGLLLLEDNPYGLFHAGGERTPTLKALDTGHNVVYLGSYAKSGLPGARIGFAVAEQTVVHADGAVSTFADQLAKIKSMLTVNTPPVAQAVIGGKLLENECSLVRANTRETATYRTNLRTLLDGLLERFGDPRCGITWNQPSGGFFLVLTVPFRVDDALLEHSARKYGVIWTPMHHFYAGQDSGNQIRLSFSLLTPERIEDGLDRLASLFAEQSG